MPTIVIPWLVTAVFRLHYAVVFCGPFLRVIHCSWNQGALDHKSRYVLILDSAPGSADGTAVCPGWEQ